MDEYRSRTYERAVENLHRIAKTLNASVRMDVCNPYIYSAVLETPRYRYTITCDSVIRYDKKLGKAIDTCIDMIEPMPAPEVVASVLLILKHDPRKFITWRRQMIRIRMIRISR